MTKRRSQVKAPRIYQKRRNAAGAPYFYGDFRMLRDVGGKQEALKPVGSTVATTDPSEAQVIFAARLQALHAAREARASQPPETWVDPTRFPERLGPAFVVHLERLAATGTLARGTIAFYEKCAKTLLRVLGNVVLSSITASVLSSYVERRRAERNPKTGEGIAARTIRNELHGLSNLIARAIIERVVAKSPFDGWNDMPTVDLMEQSFLTREQGRLLLAAGEEADARASQRRLEPRVGTIGSDGKKVAPVGPREHEFHATILATFLYTGGRLQEVLGLAVGDVDLEIGRVTFQDNHFRTLKRRWHRRQVPIPASMVRRLRRHIARLPDRGTRAALIPGVTGQPMVTIKKMLASCAATAGLAHLEFTAHSLRHTFATAMMQTYVEVAKGVFAMRSNWDVAKLLGHRKTLLVDEVYAHWVTHPQYERTLDFEPTKKVPISRRRGAKVRGSTRKSATITHRRALSRSAAHGSRTG
ncbi:MAG: site-specific integrase [Proteobacteria bacterium]|nr:site-specific integrase [Pseudomonadota bacterium]